VPSRPALPCPTLPAAAEITARVGQLQVARRLLNIHKALAALHADEDFQADAAQVRWVAGCLRGWLPGWVGGLPGWVGGLARWLAGWVSPLPLGCTGTASLSASLATRHSGRLCCYSLPSSTPSEAAPTRPTRAAACEGGD
jgi:hypothetical protein